MRGKNSEAATTRGRLIRQGSPARFYHLYAAASPSVERRTWTVHRHISTQMVNPRDVTCLPRFMAAGPADPQRRCFARSSLLDSEVEVSVCWPTLYAVSKRRPRSACLPERREASHTVPSDQPELCFATGALSRQSLKILRLRPSHTSAKLSLCPTSRRPLPIAPHLVAQSSWRRKRGLIPSV